MFARAPLFAVFCCLAGTLCIASGGVGCDWQPVTRDVQPERILEGPTRIETALGTGRFVLVRRFDADGDHFAIVDWDGRTACDLPPEVQRVQPALLGPTGQRNDYPTFLLPLAVQDGDKQVLRFVDERCKSYGDYGVISANFRQFALDEDGREVVLHGNGAGVVSLADPWRSTTKVVAEKVQTFQPVARSGLTEPQRFWFIENGKLTQRALDGTLLLTLGTAVTTLTDGLFDTLRVAFVDGGDLYEAVAPNFEPTLIGKGACAAVYRGDSLDRYEPCAKKQLVRGSLYSGETETFDEGVYSSYAEGGITWQARTDPKDGKLHMTAKPAGKPPAEITPPFVFRPLVLDGTHAAGLVDCVQLRLALSGSDPSADAGVNEAIPDSDDPFMQCVPGELSFVTWTYGAATMQPMFHRVVELMPPYADTNQGTFYWLTLYNRRVFKLNDEGVREWSDERVLAVFDQRSMKLETVATNVPVRDPLRNGRGVRGYGLERSAAHSLPLLLYSAESQPTAIPEVPRGTLHVRLLSGALDSTIARDVTSYVLVASPLLGVLYGVEEGDAGLWFAAL